MEEIQYERFSILLKILFLRGDTYVYKASNGRPYMSSSHIIKTVLFTKGWQVACDKSKSSKACGGSSSTGMIEAVVADVSATVKAPM